LSEIGGDYDDGDESDKDDEFLDDWDNKDVEDEGLDDDDDDELPDDGENEDENIGELDDNDDYELPDDWDNNNVEVEGLDDDDELLDDWNNEDADNKDLDNNTDVKFPEDGNREEIDDDRFNEGKLNKEENIETLRKTIITAKNAHINSNEKFENEPNNVSKDKLKEPINTPINAGERGGRNKKLGIPKKFCGLEPKDIMTLHFLYDQNFEKPEGKEGIKPLGKPIQLKENSLTGENLKQSKEFLDLQKPPQSQEEIKEISNELDLCEIPQSMEELNALGDYQNKNIVKNSVHRLMRMPPEQRESLGLSRGYTSYELDVFFAQIDPLSNLDNSRAKPSEVSNPKGSEPIFHNDSLDGKSDDFKKKSVNKTTEEKMRSESEINQKEKSSILIKRVVLKNVYNNDLSKYKGRFPASRDVFNELDIKKLKSLEIPEDLFYKIDKSFHCKDVEFIRKLYEEFKSYPEIERFFRGRDIEIVPNQQIIKEIVRNSFESKEKYEIWKSNIYLREYQNIAIEKEGRCISKEYVNNRTPLKFECKNGHIFNLRPDNVKEHWCPECVFNELRLGLEVFQEIARKKGGKCISEEYVNNRTPLEFECKNGHIFKMRPDVVKEGGWCHECYFDELRLGLEVFQEIARKKGGRCISEKYENNYTLLEFECKNSHIFKMRPDVVKRGGWCHECYFDELRLGLEVFREIAREHEGRCISEKYENNYTFLEFECKKGHIFKRRPFRVKEGYWCPECREHICHYGNLPEVNCRNMELPKGLKQHLELIKKTRDFPKEVRNEVSNMTNGLTNISRISAF